MAALIRLTDTLAAETASHGGRVFAVDPGVDRTRVSRAWLPWLKAVFDALSGRVLSARDELEVLARGVEAIRSDDRYVMRSRT